MDKCEFCGFLKPMFSLFRKGCLLYKTSKIVFLYLFSRSMTWEYRGLQGVTGCYKRLQGVTVGYKGLQGVTRGDRGLQSVTKYYRNFVLTRTFPDPFSRTILHQKSKLKKY